MGSLPDELLSSFIFPECKNLGRGQGPPAPALPCPPGSQPQRSGISQLPVGMSIMALLFQNVAKFINSLSRAMKQFVRRVQCGAELGAPFEAWTSAWGPRASPSEL